MKLLKPKSYKDYIQHQADRHTSLTHEYPLSPWHDDIFTEFKEHLASPIVDIGCRNGKLLDKLTEEGYDAWGIEITDIAQFAREKGRNVVQEDIQKKTSFDDNFFKTAIMTHSLEHCYNPSAALRETSRILNGYIYLVIPFGGYDTHFGHYASFESFGDVIKLLEENGFKIDKQYSKGNAYNYIFANNL